jgi:uncharacterized damage-inducible protein DinB
MSLPQNLLKELKSEAAVTRRYLASVPFDKADWQPHSKSEKLGRLAIHLAEIVAWWKEVILNEELDFIDFEPENIQSTEELLAFFDGLLQEAETALNGATDEDFEKNWTMRYGDDILFTLPKNQVVRIFCMNHFVHHRAQLGVYLRMLDIPVPAAYGPSADDYNITLINPF